MSLPFHVAGRVWDAIGAGLAAVGVVTAWLQDFNAGLVASAILALTGAFTVAYKQIARVRLDSELERIREIARVEAEAKVEAARILAQEASDHAVRVSGKVDKLKERLAQEGVLPATDGGSDERKGAGSD